jgi:signal transduction histidine kinase
VKLFPLSISLHGLRVQVLLWTVLPLIIFLLIFSLSGVSSHQSSMRALASEENSRLVIALAELIAVRTENIALRTGIAAAQVSAESLDLERVLRMEHENAVSTLVLLDGDGNILFAYGESPGQAQIALWDGVEEALRRETGVLFTSESMHDDIVAYAPVPNSEWSLIIRESWHSLTAPLIRYEQVMPFILFTASAVSLLILFFGVRYLVQPLRELSVRATRIGQGDFASSTQAYSGVQEIVDLSLALDEMALRIQNYQGSLHDYVGAVTQAQEEERARLARELHDETVQTLIALGHKAQMVQRSLNRDPEQAEARVGELRRMLGQAVDEVRRFSRALHPHYLEELGLITALETLAQEANAYFAACGTPLRLKPEKELTIYRIAQEALNNARRHAQTDTIRVELEFKDEMVILRVTDNGLGFTVPDYFYDLTRTGHFGLIGMRERAQLVNGRLSIVSQPGKGTQVSLSITA